MSHKKITVVDYGVGNLLSVRRSLEKFGAEVDITSDPELIQKANKLVLPGVGAFPQAMKLLKDSNLDVAIREFISRERPLLAICLGMQLLMEEGEEFEYTAGLGVFKGKVSAIPSVHAGLRIKSPHIGWSKVLKAPESDWGGTILRKVNEGESMYFAHSFMVEPQNPLEKIAICHIDGLEVCVGVKKGYVTGFQFHPEKSSTAGLKIVMEFANGNE